MQRFLPCLIFVFSLPFLAKAQTEYKSYQINGTFSHSFYPKEVKDDFKVELTNLEAPSPNGDSYKSFLMRQKIESRKEYPIKINQGSIKKSTQADPIIGKGIAMKRTLFNGLVRDVTGGIPNDNAMAISNDGIIISAINSMVWAYDLNADTNLLPDDVISLQKVANGKFTDRYYDPKLIYDEKADRFILVFLKDNVPATSRIMICFSKTNNPLDGWNVYSLPGNPLDNNRWTDFPAINITDEELFVTGNLIVPGVSWQIGFDGSVIWQVDKQAGFNNDSILPSKLYSQISHNGKFTRNLHPVRGTGSSSADQYFLSNRNFDITNDTMFVMKIDGNASDSTTTLKVTATVTDVNYGVPPNGRQQDTDLSDPTKGLQTNDARVLGAITNGDWIQYVSTTVNPQTGFAGIYHGFISNPTEANQSIKGHILGDPILDFGYPNIAFAGNDPCDVEAIIGLNFTSPNDFPGVGAFYFGNDSSYSNFKRLKDGEDYTDRHSDSYERWGDYFAIQPKFNEPGTVWTAGYMGLANNLNGTWINELKSPDKGKIEVTTIETAGKIYCKGELEFIASGGVPPYLFSFNGGLFEENTIVDSLCDGDTVNYSVVDSKGCIASGTKILDKTVTTYTQGIFPNPASTDIVALFYLNGSQKVEAYLYDIKGAMVKKLIDQQGKAGKNELYFDVSSLSNGIYVLKVLGNGKEIYSQKVVKGEL